MTKTELYTIAKNTIQHLTLEHDGECGQVGCALESESGNIYTGINIDLADMLKHGEMKIKRLIAVYKNGNILPPCGRCREFMIQVNKDNLNTLIILPDFKEIPLKELLPELWIDHE